MKGNEAFVKINMENVTVFVKLGGGEMEAYNKVLANEESG